MDKKPHQKTTTAKLSLKQKSLLKDALKTQMPATDVEKMLTKAGLNGAFPKGMKKVIAKNIKIEGLSKSTGKILKGFKYAKGGKIIRTKPLAKCEAKK